MTTLGTCTRRGFLSLVATSAFALGGCAPGDNGPAATGDVGGRRIAMLLDDGINDGGWGASCYEAMVGAADDLGWETLYSEHVAQSDWTTVLQSYCDQGVDLVFATSDKFDDAVMQVAEDNPESRFTTLASTKKAGNVVGMMPDSMQIGALAGSLGALLSKSGKLGFVGGVEITATTTKADSFAAAAKKVNPASNTSVVYANTYSDVAKGQEIASAMVGGGVDVIFGDASAVDAGIRETLSSNPGTYNIAQPSDLGSSDDGVIACSVVTDNRIMLEQVMRDVENDSFGDKVVEGTMENGAIRVGTFSDALVDADTREKYAVIVEQIKAGSFV